MSMGERIREARRQKGLSQEEVARELGISRQAVTKWEGDQSVPSAGNLKKLAALLETTPGRLLNGDTGEKAAAADYYALFREEEARRAAQRREQGKKNIRMAACVLGGYLAVYLLGRLPALAGGEYSLLGWLLETDWQRLPYLYGWLTGHGIFWWAAAVSVLPAFWGRWKFSWVTFAAFLLGLAVGEAAGSSPAAAPYGHGEYGWAIWGGIFLLAIGMGAALERLPPPDGKGRSRGQVRWGICFLAGIGLVVVLVRCLL